VITFVKETNEWARGDELDFINKGRQMTRYGFL
jgi:hypothetical protein